MNRLIQMTPTEKKLGWFYWAFQLLLLPVILVLLNDHFGAPMTETELNFLFFALNFVLLLLIFHKFVFHSCGVGLRRPLRTLWSAALGFLLYQLASAIAGYMILRLQPDFINANNEAIYDMLDEQYTLIFLGTVVLAPIAEELMYRGLIFGSLYSRSRLLAYAVSSCVFAFVHIDGYITVYDTTTILLCLLQYLPAGLCLGWAYARSGSILAPALAHVLVNLISVNAMR